MKIDRNDRNENFDNFTVEKANFIAYFVKINFSIW